jgi:hypothetical protein
MHITLKACPLCTIPGARIRTALGKEITVRIACQHCGLVLIDGGFLTHRGPLLSAEQRAEVALWLAETKKTRSTLPPLLAEDTYHLYLWEVEETATPVPQRLAR